MFDFIGIVASLAFVTLCFALVAGMIKPSIFNRKGIAISRKNIALLIFIALLICFFIITLAATQDMLSLLFIVVGCGVFVKSYKSIFKPLATEQLVKESLIVIDEPTKSEPLQVKQKLSGERLKEIIAAIIADGVVSIDEVYFLMNWIDIHAVDSSEETFTLKAILEQYVHDGDLNEVEQSDLLVRFSKIAGVTVKSNLIPTLEAKKSEQHRAENVVKDIPSVKTHAFISLVKKSISFKYTASTGEVTQRTVKVIRDSDDRIFAHCSSRNANRTFLKRCMENVIDIETGEVLFW